MPQSSGVLCAAPAVGRREGSLAREGLSRLSSGLSVLLVAALAGLGAAALVPERYTASTTLTLAEGRGLAPVGDTPSAAAAIIASPELAREAVARMGPVSDIGAPALLPGVVHWLGAAGLLPARPRESAEALAVGAYRRALDLEPRDGAGVLVVRVAAGSADTAARAANIAAQVYLDRRADAVRERDGALGVATENVAQARLALQEAIDRASAFRADPAAADTARRAQAAAGDLSLLAAERAALLAEREAIERRLLSVNDLSGSGDLFRAPSEGVSLLRHLVEQRLTLRADLAAENRIRDARHWRVRALAARADDLDDQIAAATGSAHDWLTGERERLGRRVAEVEGAIHLRQAILAAAADNERRQRDLDHAADAARERLALAREKFGDEADRVRSGAAAARVLSVAEAPVRPDPAPPATAGAVAALLAGAAAWMLLGRGRRREAAPAAGAPFDRRPASAGAPPSTPPAGGAVSAPADASAIAPAAGGTPPAPVKVGQPLGQPLGQSLGQSLGEAGGQAIEALLGRLAIAPRADGGRHLAVLGAGDDRASVPVARALAHHLAGRERVVLLDLTAEGDAAAPGFADLVGGRASFAEIITREPGSRLHVVGRGRGALETDPADDTVLLALAALDQTYDWIVEIVPAPGRGALGQRLLDRAQGVVLVAGGGVDTEALAAYEALRERGIDNVVVGLAGR